MKSTLTALLLALLISVPAFAKRAPPPHVPELKRNGVVYSHGYEEIEGGYALYLMAKRAGQKTVLWKTRLFDLKYDKNLETDVQDVHLISLRRSRARLVAKDEAGHLYEVDAKTGKLLSPAEPIHIQPID